MPGCLAPVSRLICLAAIAICVGGCAGWRRPYRHGPPPAVVARDAGEAALRVFEAPSADTLRLNETFEVACHNCYDPDLLPSFGDAPLRTRTVEIDVLDRWGFGVGGRRGGWYVRHAGWGNRSNCAPEPASGDLAACLRVVHEWLADSTARGVMVFIDKKQPWAALRSPRALDSLIASIVPRARIYTPRKLRGAYASPRTAAAAGAWPRVRDLRGRVVFVLTGPNRRLREYVETMGDGALAFVAPNVQSVKEVDAAPKGFDAASAQSIAFYNFRFRRRTAFDLGRAIHARGFFSRSWYPLDDWRFELVPRCKLVRARINRVAHFWLFGTMPSAGDCADRKDIGGRRGESPPRGSLRLATLPQVWGRVEVSSSAYPRYPGAHRKPGNASPPRPLAGEGAGG